MVAAVATEDPETAENIAHAPIFVCKRPPGIRLSQSVRLSYMLRVMPARSKISPKSTKSGIVVRRKSFITAQRLVP